MSVVVSDVALISDSDGRMWLHQRKLKSEACSQYKTTIIVK